MIISYVCSLQIEIRLTNSLFFDLKASMQTIAVIYFGSKSFQEGTLQASARLHITTIKERSRRNTPSQCPMTKHYDQKAFEKEHS